MVAVSRKIERKSLLDRSDRVFISHSTADSHAANALCRQIESRGVRCAIAPRDVPYGSHYPSWIAESIERASAFVLLISHSSQESMAVQNEAELAFNNRGLPIYPVRIDPIDKTELSWGLRYIVSSRQMIDATKSLRDPAYRRLSKSIAREVLGRAGPERTDPLSVLGRDAQFFKQVWRRMDARNSSVAWLAEAAIGGIFWCFYRNLSGLGLALSGILAVTVLAVALVASHSADAAALTLLVGWVLIAGFLGLFGAAILRDRVRRKQVTASGRPMVAAIVSLTMLVASLFVAAGVPGVDAPGQKQLASALAPDGTLAQPPVSAAPATAAIAPRMTVPMAGDAGSWREEEAREEHLQRETSKAAAAGYVVGRVVERVEQRERHRHNESAVNQAEGPAM